MIPRWLLRVLLLVLVVVGLSSPAAAQFVHVSEDEDSGGLWNTDDQLDR
jgi:hypothetical protein